MSLFAVIRSVKILSKIVVYISCCRFRVLLSFCCCSHVSSVDYVALMNAKNLGIKFRVESYVTFKHTVKPV